MNEELVSYTTFDRCDRCGAQARAQADKEGNPSKLLFCGHHINENMDALLDAGYSVKIDESVAV